MSKSLSQVMITKTRLQRLSVVDNKHCSKCKENFVLGEEVMKKRVRLGNHKYYHLKCYERLYI